MAKTKKRKKQATTLASRMKGRSSSSIAKDLKRKAKRPGFRKTKSKRGGYFESRVNRSDIFGLGI